MIQQISMIKGEHTFIFRFREEDRDAIKQAVTELAVNPDSGLDIFDATVLSIGIDSILNRNNQGKVIM